MFQQLALNRKAIRMRTFLAILGIFIGSGLSTCPALVDKNSDIQQIRVENGLRYEELVKGEPNYNMNIRERMAYYKVPGVSIAVVNNGKIEWMQGYGRVTNDPTSALIDEHTLFQAGSISTSITAFGALLLVQQGKISLDEDVNVYLKRWKIPENECTKTEKVTLRRLLSQTAGIDVQEFPGYSVHDPIPTVVDILEGKKPLVNTAPVRVVFQPGSSFQYSGGGITIVQMLIEDVTGESFDVWMKNHVLKPLGMLESTFAQPLPPFYAHHAAYGHTLNCVPVEGKWYVYPEMAAAGLWTTPKDLAQFILYIQSGVKNGKAEPLNAYYVKEMITRQKIGIKDTEAGLGVFLRSFGENQLFESWGKNIGFNARLCGFVYHGQGVVIMMNNDSAWMLMEEMINSVADVYTWPNLVPIEKGMVPIDPSSFINFTGRYINKESEIEVSSINGKLLIEFKRGLAPLELHPAGKCTFFVQPDTATIEFLNCGAGEADSLVIIDQKNEKTVFKRK